MSSVYLSRTDEEERGPIGTKGRPLPNYFPQITAYVTDRLGASVARYFAEPVRDTISNETDWFGDGDESPQLLSTVKRADRARYLNILHGWRRQLTQLAKESAPVGSEDIHQILGLALTEPSLDDVWIVDDHPIVTNWGYVPPLRFVPIDAPPAHERSSAAESSAAKAAEERKILIHRRVKIGHWYISVLTLCMIAAISLTLGTGLLSAFGLIGDQNGRIFGALAGSDTDPTPLFNARTDNQRLRTEIEVLQDEIMSRMIECLGQCNALPAPGPVIPANPEPPVIEDELRIPEDAQQSGDLSFLEGLWRSDSGLFLDDQTPAVIEYEIDALGEGHRTIRLDDGHECVGEIRAEFLASGDLQIAELGHAPCSDSVRNISPYTVTCSVNTSDRRAQCLLKPQNDSNEVITVLRRIQ